MTQSRHLQQLLRLQQKLQVRLSKRSQFYNDCPSCVDLLFTLSISGVIQRINQALAITFLCALLYQQGHCWASVYRLQRCPIASRSSWMESFIVCLHFPEMYVFLFKRNQAAFCDNFQYLWQSRRLLIQLLHFIGTHRQGHKQLYHCYHDISFDKGYTHRLNWNLGQKSLKIIQTGTIRKLGCGFLFAFHSNYGSILHHLLDKAILVENRDFFHTPIVFYAPVRNIAITFGVGNLEWWGYLIVKKTLKICVTV